MHFAYPGEEEVLTGVDVALQPGEIVAVCGQTGAGKSTLLNLLPRFYDPTAGRVLVGGVDVRDVRLATLRDAVAVITQRPILFSITLRENLTAGRPDAGFDEVEAMCLAAGVSDFVPDLPNGYETLIGERGVNLSGGQRQRVALARALIAGARVIVLDDPLSAVDTHTERDLVGRLRPALAGAHRPRRHAAALDARARRPRRGARRRPHRRGRPAGGSARGQGRLRRAVRGGARCRVGAAPGLSRLGRYLSGRWLLVAGLIAVATGSAAAQSGGWLLVRAAIDDGIAKHDRHTLTVVVAVYLRGEPARLAVPADADPRPRRASARASSSACGATCSTT